MIPERLADILDSLCWEVRDNHGHSDNGLQDFDNGGDLPDDALHPEVWDAVARILKVIA